MAVSYSNKAHWYLFLVLPFVSAVLAIRNFRAPWSKNIMWAFVVFYGLTFGMAKEISTGDETADIERYTQELRDLYQINLSYGEITKLYEDNKDFDILRLTLAICISRFTDSQQILTGVYGLIFGFFFSRNIWFVLERLKGKLKPAVILLLTVYFFVDPFWGINGFRFNTAIHVYIYGVLIFIFGGNKKGILLSGLSIFVHFSFLLPVGILILYYVLGNRTLFYFIFFMLSIFYSGVNVSNVNEIVKENAPETLAERTATYREEESVELFRADPTYRDRIKVNWYVSLYSKGLQWTLMIFLMIFFLKITLKDLTSTGLNGSFCFALLFFGFANIMSSFPSGGRFLNVAALSVLPHLIFYIQNQVDEKFINNKVIIASPFLLLFIIVSMRIGFYSISVNTIIGNPFIVLLTDVNFALNDFIK